MDIETNSEIKEPHLIAFAFNFQNIKFQANYRPCLNSCHIRYRDSFLSFGEHPEKHETSIIS